MKPSNFRAPRTLSEGTFSVGYSSIRSHRKGRPLYGWFGWYAFAMLLIFLIWSK